ncbi:WXG100 family type VII secretion target [Mycobacteroides chelonae]|uniref:WXG100 family type VII secretion target n=1 Tax=Mycobacteroides chelonae TaxID=1774 RepID=UPI003AAD005F
MAETDLELGYDAAVQKVGQAEDILGQVKATVQRWQAEGQDMTTSSWMGASAAKFGNATEEHSSEFQRLIAKLDETMTTAKTAMGHFQSHDQES